MFWKKKEAPTQRTWLSELCNTLNRKDAFSFEGLQKNLNLIKFGSLLFATQGIQELKQTHWITHPIFLVSSTLSLFFISSRWGEGGRLKWGPNNVVFCVFFLLLLFIFLFPILFLSLCVVCCYCMFYLLNTGDYT